MNGRSVPVDVRGLVKDYNGVMAVAGIDFTVSPGTTVTLLGPSGCGKTTILRSVAGFEAPQTGRVAIGLLGVALTEVVKLIERRYAHWKESERAFY